MTKTSHLKRYARVYGRLIEYFERPAPTGRSEKYREPKQVKPEGFKRQYPTKADALRAAAEWEALA